MLYLSIYRLDRKGVLMPHEIPERKRPVDDNGYLEELTRAIFQAGFSWRVIRDKWPNFRRAFDSFDIETVAGYGEPGGTRHRAKNCSK